MLRGGLRYSSTTTTTFAASLQQALEAASLILLQVGNCYIHHPIRFPSQPSPQLLQIPNQGRGLFPTQPILSGHTIFTEQALAAIGGGTDQAGCDRCLRPMALATHPHNHSFCSTTCSQAALQEYAPVYDACDWQPLRAFCAEQGGWRFPILAARLLSRILVEERLGQHKHSCSAASSTSSSSMTLQKMSMLCHANVPHPPPEWRHAYRLLTEALTKGGVVGGAGGAVSWDMFLSVLTRCHVNAFRCVCFWWRECFVQTGLGGEDVVV